MYEYELHKIQKLRDDNVMWKKNENAHEFRDDNEEPKRQQFRGKN